MAASEELDQARRDLPHIPQEVFELWLDERIRAHGWPPLGDAWERTLAGLSVDHLRSLRWVKDYVALRPADLAPRSLEHAVRILDADIHGRQNAETAAIPDSARRFAAIWEFISSAARLPAPLVLVSTFDGYEVVEGNHRIAAMLWAAAQRGREGFFPNPVEAWIGAIRAG